MSRVHALQMPAAEVASQLGVVGASDIAIPSQVAEGDQGVIMVERDGRLTLTNARWGFPRAAIGIGEAENIGLVADLTNPMWERIVVEPANRCIIAITHFCNPDGGGVWALDGGGSDRTLLGQRVTVEGTRSGFDRLDVDWLGPARS